MTYGAVAVGVQAVTRPEVEDWLYAEADILDAWDYDGWLALFEETVRATCPEPSVAYLMEKAHRIARSLELGCLVGQGQLPHRAR